MTFIVVGVELISYLFTAVINPGIPKMSLKNTDSEGNELKFCEIC